MSSLRPKDLIKRYNLPKEIRFCKNVLSPIKDQESHFKKRYMYCLQIFTFKKTILIGIKKKKLLKLLNKHRKNDGSYDVVVPCSGGKDGSFAHKLKNEYGISSLCYVGTFGCNRISKQNLRPS